MGNRDPTRRDTAASFLFAVCQVGAERTLKEEVARLAPELHPAFARPGLVTWKSAGPLVGADFSLSAVFARAYGAALGSARDENDLWALIDRLGAKAPLRLHVFARDRNPPVETRSALSKRVIDAAEVLRVRAEVLTHLPGQFLDGEIAQSGDYVLDLVVAEGEPLFVGHHLHSPLHSPWPGGRIPVEVPPDAPSRAYRKLEEAIAWSGAAVQRGQIAVEIGSSPGGASYALLRRGLEVIGVDPAAMDPVVLASPKFRHIQRPLAEVTAADLPRRVDWLLMDIHLAPQVALHAIRGLLSQLRPSLSGILFTIKLNDWALAALIPDFIARIEGMGISDVRATQLPSNRQEIFIYGRAETRSLTRTKTAV